MSDVSDSELQNRFGYHRANEVSAPQHAAIRELMLETARMLVEITPSGRDQALALTHLQESMHWANSAIAMENDLDPTPNIPNQ